jgi:hypothetical protein
LSGFLCKDSSWKILSYIDVTSAGLADTVDNHLVTALDRSSYPLTRGLPDDTARLVTKYCSRLCKGNLRTNIVDTLEFA